LPVNVKPLKSATPLEFVTTVAPASVAEPDVAVKLAVTDTPDVVCAEPEALTN
jgi:hypothetical protein